jgi:ATP-dependent DNA ligase
VQGEIRRARDAVGLATIVAAISYPALRAKRREQEPRSQRGLLVGQRRLHAPPRSTRFGSPLVLFRVHWAEPKLVAKITFLTWTTDNLLRHTVYVGLREDKPADDVRREAPLTALELMSSVL